MNDRPLDWSSYRARYSVFSERVYLASQCMGPYPRQAHRDIEQYRTSRLRHNRTLEDWFERVALTTKLIERLLAAPDGSVALLESCTAAHGAILSAFAPTSRRDRLVVTELDFHSTLHACTAQQRRGFTIDIVPSRDGCRIDPLDVVSRIDERTAIVAISQVSRYGALLALDAIVRRAHEVGAVVIVDAYQAVGIVPLDVVALGVDALIGGNHKWLSGDTGLAFLYVEPTLAERLEPGYPGWFGHHDIADFVRVHTFVDSFRPLPGARRFQQGSPSLMPIYSARAGLELVLDMGVDRMRQRNLALVARLLSGAEELGLRARTPREPTAHAGGACIEVPDPERVVALLCAQGIDVDQRRREVVRAAPHPCNTEEEVDHFLRRLRDAVDHR